MAPINSMEAPINAMAGTDHMMRTVDVSHGMYSYGFGAGYMLFNLAIYLFFSYCQYSLSKKMNIKYSWMAWVPVLNIFNLTKIAGLSYWWILGFIVPLWNIYAMIRVMHGVSKNTGHGAGWTVGMIFLYIIFFPITALTYVPVTKNPDAPLTQE